jgi:IS5 family transposase
MAYATVYQMSLISGLLESRLDPEHELLVLAKKIDWEAIEASLKPFYKLRGRRAKNVRLMVGLHLLKHRFNHSDADVVQGLSENLYWMAFCGLDGELTSVTWTKALDPSTMTNFRKRLGAKGVALIEDVIRKQLIAERQVSPKVHLVDTTAMAKNVAYPTDTNLLDHGRRLIVKTVAQLNDLGVGAKVRSFARKGKKALLNLMKLGKDRQERIEKSTKELIDYANQVLTKIPGVLKGGKRSVDEKLKKKVDLLKAKLRVQRDLLKRVIAQSEARMNGLHLKDKVLSHHEPHVVAIAKGKRGRPNEYGCKVSISIDRNGYVVGHQEYDENASDLKTLDLALKHWEEVCGAPAEELGADRGYHTSDPSQEVKRIPKVSIPTKGKKSHPDKKKPYFRRLQRRRAGIEPVIGHLKSDHRMDCSRYKGFEGDKMNVSWAVLAWNTKKWARSAGKGRK